MAFLQRERGPVLGTGPDEQGRRRHRYKFLAGAAVVTVAVGGVAGCAKGSQTEKGHGAIAGVAETQGEDTSPASQPAGKNSPTSTRLPSSKHRTIDPAELPNVPPPPGNIDLSKPPASPQGTVDITWLGKTVTIPKPVGPKTDIFPNGVSANKAAVSLLNGYAALVSTRQESPTLGLLFAATDAEQAELAQENQTFQTGSPEPYQDQLEFFSDPEFDDSQWAISKPDANGVMRLQEISGKVFAIRVPGDKESDWQGRDQLTTNRAVVLDSTNNGGTWFDITQNPETGYTQVVRENFSSGLEELLNAPRS